jgi:hypothetical protein
MRNHPITLSNHTGYQYPSYLRFFWIMRFTHCQKNGGFSKFEVPLNLMLEASFCGITFCIMIPYRLYSSSEMLPFYIMRYGFLLT